MPSTNQDHLSACHNLVSNLLGLQHYSIYYLHFLCQITSPINYPILEVFHFKLNEFLSSVLFTLLILFLLLNHGILLSFLIQKYIFIPNYLRIRHGRNHYDSESIPSPNNLELLLSLKFKCSNINIGTFIVLELFLCL